MNKRRKDYLKVKNIKNNNMPKHLKKVIGRLTQEVVKQSL